MTTFSDLLFVDSSIKLVIAVLLAGVLGLERQLTGHAAGLRTNVLVCLGSTLMMVVSSEIAREFNEAAVHTWLDRGRIAAGIITGIGFIGAGTIMNIGSEQRGLTTAAMIWVVAAIGIAVGAGYVQVAVCATVLALLVVQGLERVEHLLPAYERFNLSIRMPKALGQVREIEGAIRERGFRVAASRIKIAKDEEEVDMTFELAAASGPDIEELAQMLHSRFPTAERITFER